MTDPQKCYHPSVFPLPDPPPQVTTCKECGRKYVRQSDGIYMWIDPGQHHEIGQFCTKDDCTETHRPLDPERDDYDLLVNSQTGDLIEVPPPTKQRPGDQVLPSGDERRMDDQQWLIDRITERRQVGIERYGQGHRPFNGRNTFLDFFEEHLDGLVYLASILRATEADRDVLVREIARAIETHDERADKPGDWRDAPADYQAKFVVARIYGWLAGQRMSE